MPPDPPQIPAETVEIPWIHPYWMTGPRDRARRARLAGCDSWAASLHPDAPLWDDA